MTVCAQAAGGTAATSAAVEAGRLLYERGQAADGHTLSATWGSGLQAEGAPVACAQCHRPSGHGVFEGETLVPPVTARALFRAPLVGDACARPAAGALRVAAGLRANDFRHRTRPPYDSRRLARALTAGIGSDGHPLSPLMPRYRLSPRDRADLEAYLRQLARRPSPGVEGCTVHFATVLAPDTHEADREAVRQVLQSCFDERFPADRTGGTRWQLHVWPLEGAPAQWASALAERQRQRPVMALVSGLGGAQWQPVHRFCEAEGVPCLFPNVDLPGAREPGQHSFYFSGGTWLEAAVVHRWLQELPPQPGRTDLRLWQVVPTGQTAASAGAQAAAPVAAPAGATAVASASASSSASAHASAIAQAGAQLLAERAAAGSGLRPMPPVDGSAREQTVAALQGLKPGDTLMLWLDAAALDALARIWTPPPDVHLVASASLADPAQLSLEGAWRERLRLVHRPDPPGRRALRMRFNLHPWLQARGLPVHAREDLQGNTLAACNLLGEAMSAQRDVPTRAQLIEAIENYPSAMGNAPAPQWYPQFSLGTGQRISSNGAYMVRLAEPQGGALAPVSGWIVAD